MAYFTRAKMLEMIDTIGHTNEFFERRGSSGNERKDLELLIGCQQMVIALADYIDSLGADTGCVTELLETVCECIYAQAENLGNRQMVVEEAKKLSNILPILKDAIEEEIVEISSISIVDFSNLGETADEKRRIRREINRLVDTAVKKDGPIDIGIEYNIPIVVGTYM
ncbi:MAG: hypothetical protein HUJ71_09585 [Pseudobutyrivibrio sp.]|nr:hypothetical protein [Pseudobutyrivibrio sp.]